MKKQATYPQRLSFVERLAKKVITRVVSDGIPLDNAVKEAVSFAQLNTQQIFHLCSVLEDWGQVFNGDPKNYFYTATDMGKQFPNSQNGYVVYASAGNSEDKIQQVFKTITALKKQGFSDNDILAINGELKDVLNVINEFNTDYKTLVSEYEAAKTAPQQAPEKGWMEKGKDWLGQQVQNIMPQPGMVAQPASASVTRVVTSQVAPEEVVDENPETKKATPGNIDRLKAAPEADLEVEEEPVLGGEDTSIEEPALGGDMEVEEDLGGSVSAPVKPTPSELTSQLESAPKWEVKNVLSMQMAERFYKDIQKKLDEVVSNPNIDWSASPEAVAKYDKVRAKIEEALNKISEAQKGAEKIEKKEGELEQKYQTSKDLPTDELIAGEPIEEEPMIQEEPTLEVPEA
jgi:hypothetical protein